jgi:hypothetical protein
MTTYRLRVDNGPRSKDGDAYVTRRPDGLPVFTWRETQPMSKEDAEALKADADRTCGGTIYLERA